MCQAKPIISRKIFLMPVISFASANVVAIFAIFTLHHTLALFVVCVYTSSLSLCILSVIRSFACSLARSLVRLFVHSRVVCLYKFSMKLHTCFSPFAHVLNIVLCHFSSMKNAPQLIICRMKTAQKQMKSKKFIALSFYRSVE